MRHRFGSRWRGRAACLLLTVLLGWFVGACRAETPAERMPVYAPGEPPPARTDAEVRAILAGFGATQSEPAESEPVEATPLRIVLVAGPKDHGPGEHDYPAWLDIWSRMLRRAEGVTVQTAWETPSPEQAADADVIVFYQRGDWNDERAALLDPFLARGGGLVLIHWAVNGGDRHEQMAERTGLASKAGSIGYRHGPVEIDFSSGAEHPITRGLERVRWVDETYWRLAGDAASIDTLGVAVEEGAPWPQFWAYRRGPGRVFVTTLGHYAWTFDDPIFRLLMLRGFCWAGGAEVGRLHHLVVDQP